MIRGMRGAITIGQDTPEQVLEATRELVSAIISANDIEPEMVASVIVSATPDITSAFPAKAVRTLDGWKYVPVMCTHEMNVQGALPLCIRVMMHVETELSQKDVRHIFLKDAVKLRPDLTEEGKEQKREMEKTT